MFSGSRRHRPPVTHQTSATTNPNAATAAASAFMAASNQTGNRNLSSAAAAAALRARPHTPIDVGAVETKRTQRRSASVSSHGSSAQPGPRQSRSLERKYSSGSMTERTFRTPSPSPHRAAAAAPAQPEPPVPQIPANHRKTQSATNVGMQTFRTASQKIKATPPSWYGQSHGDISNIRTSDAAMRPNGHAADEHSDLPARSESRASSINYSYPTTYRPQSPPASPTSYRAPIPEEPRVHAPASPPRSSRTSAASSVGGRAEPALVYDPNSRRMVPAPQPSNIDYHVREAANHQPKKKKKQYQGLGRSGSHLAKGTVGRAKGTAVDDVPREAQRAPAPFEPEPVAQVQPRPVEAKSGPTHREDHEHERGPAVLQPKPQKPRESHFTGGDVPNVELSAAPVVSSPPERLASPPPARAVGKKPSMVKEDPEGEEDVPEIITSLSQKVLEAAEASPTAIAHAQHRIPTQIEAEEESDSEDDQEAMMTPHALTTHELHHDSRSSAKAQQPISFAENKMVAELAKEAAPVKRADSISPDRRARFGPSVAEKMVVRHQPPPRSASPIKSALKRTGNSSRDVSPSETGSDANAVTASAMLDPAAARKKSARVSFDERSNVIMGESAGSGGVDSTTSSPPNSKRPWYSSLGRSKKRDVTLDDDEVMKPRPALPSFGSVREKKAREVEERPLVRPSDATRSTADSSSPARRPASPEVPTYRTADEQAVLEASSDQAIGPVLSRDQEKRNTANTCRFREPLPPVVTSIEGDGYHMETTTDESDNDLFDQSETSIDDSTAFSTQASHQGQDESSATTAASRLEAVEDKVLLQTEKSPRAVVTSSQPVPAISVVLPTPLADEETPKSSDAQQYFDVPGGFPGEDSDNAEMETATNSIASSAILEPEPAVYPVQAATLPQTTLVTTGLNLQAGSDADSSSNESVYSDAYEDLSDMEGGFMSIDAVVESPVINNTSPITSQAHATPTRKGKSADVQETPEREDKSNLASSAFAPASSAAATSEGEDWAQVQSFWRSLTAEKRQQLAREALEDEGIEGDREEVSKPVRRNSSRKKTAEQRQQAAEKKQQQPLEAETDLDTDSRRTYMIQPGSKTKHAVPPSPEATHMRKSLRGPQPSKSAAATATAPGTGTLRKSMRGGPEPRATAPATAAAIRAKNSRPATSSGGRSNPSNVGLSTGTGLVDPKAASAALAKQMMPKLTRRGSDASDSSFQRARRPASSAGFGFRSSMRQAPATRKETSPVPRGPTKSSSRWSLRSLSPPATFRRNSSSESPQTGMMRHSLRTGASPAPKRTSLQLAFSKAPKPASQGRTKASRFQGSSDEDEDMASGFQSRYVDSSDEEAEQPGSSQGSVFAKGSLRKPSSSSNAVRKATPVPEEPEDMPQPTDYGNTRNTRTAVVPTTLAARPLSLSRSTSDNIGTTTLRPAITSRGSFTANISTNSPPSPRERRGSFMGILRRKRSDQPGKIQRSGRDTELLREIRGDQSPTTSRSHKRPSGRPRENSWPLPEEEEDDKDDAADDKREEAGFDSPVHRPASSNGKLIKGIGPRPNLSSRRSTSLGLPGISERNGNGTASGSRMPFDQESLAAMSEAGMPKKKKFGSLRRMFGLTG